MLLHFLHGSAVSFVFCSGPSLLKIRTFHLLTCLSSFCVLQETDPVACILHPCVHLFLFFASVVAYSAEIRASSLRHRVTIRKHQTKTTKLLPHAGRTTCTQRRPRTSQMKAVNCMAVCRNFSPKICNLHKHWVFFWGCNGSIRATSKGLNQQQKKQVPNVLYCHSGHTGNNDRYIPPTTSWKTCDIAGTATRRTL